MGRHSNLQLATLAAIKRPEPPENMIASQKEVWHKIVNRLPPEWFPEETHPLLIQYCRMVVRAERLGRLLDAKPSKEEFLMLLPQEVEVTKQLISLSTRMRITQQSTYAKSKSKKLYSARTAGKQPWRKDQDETDES